MYISQSFLAKSSTIHFVTYRNPKRMEKKRSQPVEEHLEVVSYPSLHQRLIAYQ